MTVTASLEQSGPQAFEPPRRSVGARIAWTCVGLVLAIALVAAFVLSMVGSAAYQALAPSKRVFTTSLTELTVRTDNGEITVERSADRETRVTTSGVHGLTYPTDVEHVVGSILTIRSNCGTRIFNDRCDRNFVVHVPAGVAVTADSGEGNVRVTGMDRAVSAHSDQGDVTISGGSGTVQASSGQGSVTVSQSSASSVSVTSGQGDVAIDLIASPTRITASSGQGAVTVELPKGPNSYQVHASSGQGNVVDTVFDNPESNRVINATSGQGDVAIRYRAQ